MKEVFNAPVLFCAMAVFVVASIARAQDTSQVPPWPGDVSVAGLQATAAATGDSSGFNMMVSEEIRNRAVEFVQETRHMGLQSRAGAFSVSSVPANVQVNNNTGDRVGETQAEVAIAVNGDTVVIGWNDSRGFTVGTSPGVGTLSGFGYSTNGGATFTDGGTTQVAAAADECFGDPGVDTDEKGNWYYNQIYTVGTTQQNIAVHHGRFSGGVLAWDTPVQADVAILTNSSMDKCLLGCDRVTGNVYVSATRFSTIGLPPVIEIVRSTDHGATWGAPIVLDNTTTPTASKQGSRPFCGPNGEVYVVWEKAANSINCPDGSGNVTGFNNAQIAFTRSLNNGASYDPFTVIASLVTDFMASGPGDLRERANEFPDIAVDRSGGANNGIIYVTWHESAPWTANLSAGPATTEAADAANNNPGGAELFNIGDDVNGSMSSTADLDYWQFSATQGQSLLFNLDPQGFVCGVSGTSKGMRMRLFATQSPYPNPNGFPDTLVAASAQGTFTDRIVWTAPKTGTYLVRLQRSNGTTPFTYRLRVRNLTFGSPTPARDARDVIVVRSTNQGLSWSSKQLVNDDPAGLENRRPFICVDGHGYVSAFWHDSRTPGLGSNAALTSVFGSTSTDGGVTWGANYPVTDELSFFSFNTIAVPNLGDYNQAAANCSGVIHPAWSDQRLSTGDVRTPGTNTFTAGRGPETYTTSLSFPFPPSCPANIVKSNDAGQCGAVVTYTTPTSPGCVTVNCSPASGSFFPVGTTTVTCTASSGETCSFMVTVHDTTHPTITGVSSSPAVLWPPDHTMRDITVAYTATDNCGTPACTLTVASNEPINGTGDGDTSPDWVIVDAHHVQLRAERAGTGNGRIYTITITCTDSSGNSTTQTTTVTVAHNITGPISGASFKIGTPVNFSGTFWDVAGKTHTATWLFDNITTAGSVVEPSGFKNGTVNGTYTFTTPGVFKVTMNITDNQGSTSWVNTQGDMEAIVVIYDPSAGYTVGGGWIASPAGAYPANPSLTGKVSFGFTSKYFKNATNPKGETQFEFKDAGFALNALNFDYLAISGIKAQFKGLGKGSDSVAYKFILTVSDGNLSGGDGIDRFRMKIYNKNTGAVVYDNQMGASEAADPITPVGTGSSIIIQSTTSSGEATPQDPTPHAEQVVPKDYGLYQNYPNPFNPTTEIVFDLPELSTVKLVITDVLGNEVKMLVNGEEKAAGQYHVRWSGETAMGTPAASGIYFLRMTSATSTGDRQRIFTRKMLLMR
jgi:flagellar hook capping protein FlgD/HYR domain-containing protein